MDEMDNYTHLKSLSETKVQFNLYDFSQVPYWARMTVLVYLTFVLVIGTTGNGLLIMVEIKNKTKSTTDFFILTMAVHELLCSVVTSPLNILRNTSSVWPYLASPTYCKILAFVSFNLGLSSVLLLAVISVDRYVKTCQPLDLAQTFTTKHAKIICIAITVTGIVLAIPTLPTYSTDKLMNCEHKKEFLDFMQRYKTALVIITLLGFIVMSFSYIKVGHVVRKSYRLHRSTLIVANSTKTAYPRFLNRILYMFRRRKIKPTCGCYKPRDGSLRTVDCTPSTSAKPIYASGSQPAGLTAQNSDSDQAICACKCTLNRVSSTSSQPALPSAIQKRFKEESLINRTTRILFLITFVYFITFCLQWLTVLSGYSLFGLVARFFSLTVNMINCITNPLFIFSMNTKYRYQAFKLIYSRVR